MNASFYFGQASASFCLVPALFSHNSNKVKKKKKNFKKSKEMRVFASVADKIFHTGATSLSLPYMMTWGSDLFSLFLAFPCECESLSSSGACERLPGSYFAPTGMADAIFLAKAQEEKNGDFFAAHSLFSLNAKLSDLLLPPFFLCPILFFFFLFAMLCNVCYVSLVNFQYTPRSPIHRFSLLFFFFFPSRVSLEEETGFLFSF